MHVNAASNEIICGADIGYLSQLEKDGVSWVDDNGNAKDVLVLLKEKGVNAVRLCLFLSTCIYDIVKMQK